MTAACRLLRSTRTGAARRVRPAARPRHARAAVRQQPAPLGPPLAGLDGPPCARRCQHARRPIPSPTPRCPAPPRQRSHAHGAFAAGHHSSSRAGPRVPRSRGRRHAGLPARPSDRFHGAPIRSCSPPRNAPPGRGLLSPAEGHPHLPPEPRRQRIPCAPRRPLRSTPHLGRLHAGHRRSFRRSAAALGHRNAALRRPCPGGRRPAGRPARPPPARLPPSIGGLAAYRRAKAPTSEERRPNPAVPARGAPAYRRPARRVLADPG